MQALRTKSKAPPFEMRRTGHPKFKFKGRATRHPKFKFKGRATRLIPTIRSLIWSVDY
jgi:hypothetical protein